MKRKNQPHRKLQRRLDAAWRLVHGRLPKKPLDTVERIKAHAKALKLLETGL